MSLRLAPGLAARIAAHVRGAYPDEACGLLIGARAGDAVHVDDAIASANTAPEGTRATRFEIDPELLLRTHRTLRGTGRAVVGHYHSHPEGKPELSQADRAAAHEPGHVWIVVAVAPDGRLAARAFLQDGAAPEATFRSLGLLDLEDPKG